MRHEQGRKCDDDGDGTPFSFEPAAIVTPRVRILREVQDTKEELEALEATRHLLHDNPRELKRLVNVHRLVKILLQRAEAPGQLGRDHGQVVERGLQLRPPGRDVALLAEQARTVAGVEPQVDLVAVDVDRNADAAAGRSSANLSAEA